MEAAIAPAAQRGRNMLYIRGTKKTEQPPIAVAVAVVPPLATVARWRRRRHRRGRRPAAQRNQAKGCGKCHWLSVVQVATGVAMVRDGYRSP